MPSPSHIPTQTAARPPRTGSASAARDDAARAEWENALRERDEIIAQYERLQGEWRGAAEAKTAEMAALVRSRTEALADLEETRKKDREQLTAMLASYQAALADRDQARRRISEIEGASGKQRKSARSRKVATAGTAALEKERDAYKAAADKLLGERTEALRDRDEIAAKLAAEEKAHAEKLQTLHGQLQETGAPGDESVANRDGHGELLELRDYLEGMTSSHRPEPDASREEDSAVQNKLREMAAFIERDRLSSRKQIELFSEERETLVHERDETAAELARERQALGHQIYLRKRECENLAAQRSALLTQLNELRDAHQRQIDLFNQERQVLIAARDALSRKLDHAQETLGMDQATLLQHKLDAEARLAAAVDVHHQEVQAVQQARNTARQERDAALAELQPIRLARSREVAALGALSTSKYEAMEPFDPHVGGRRSVRDTVIGREVEMNICRGEASAPANAALLEEIRHLGRLQHPSIPPIYEAGLDETGRVYYTTKTVAGMNLGEILQQLECGTIHTVLHFTLKRLLGVFHKVCDAVAFAHAQGVTHGDLRPEHILLGDFGDVLVTHWSPRANAVPGATLATDIHGDIMALGRLLYQITTLEMPPDPGAVRSESAIRKKDSRTPSRYWDGDRKVKTLIALARRACDRRSEGTIQSAREFQMQVDAFKDSFDDPRHLTLWHLGGRWARGHKLAAVVVFIILVLLAGTISVGVWQIYRAGQTLRIE